MSPPPFSRRLRRITDGLKEQCKVFPQEIVIRRTLQSFQKILPDPCSGGGIHPWAQLGYAVLQCFPAPGAVKLAAQRWLLQPSNHVLDDQSAVPIRQTQPALTGFLRGPTANCLTRNCCRQPGGYLLCPGAAQTIAAIEVEMNMLIKCFLTANFSRVFSGKPSGSVEQNQIIIAHFSLLITNYGVDTRIRAKRQRVIITGLLQMFASGASIRQPKRTRSEERRGGEEG